MRFGSTVNIAAAVAAPTGPGQLLATRVVAEVGAAEGIAGKDPGRMQIRSLPDEISLCEIHVSPTPDPAWIDPVCKMPAPLATYPAHHTSPIPPEPMAERIS